MNNTSQMNGTLFADMVRCGAASLYLGRNMVNELNVFPIPDGDTGDNMYMTIKSGATALSEAADDGLDSVSSHIARGMLLGARGNSGVILSRIFAGIAEGFRDVKSADVKTVGAAFIRGVNQAYGAVSEPVEGTILTVYKEAAAYADSRIGEGSNLESFFNDFVAELRRSLRHTPELLDVLREAGVVDSGGAGFVYIAEGMKKALEGNLVSEDTAAVVTEWKDGPDYSLFTEDSDIGYGYCTEFLMRLQRSKTDIDAFDIDELTDYLTDAGESVVAFRDGSIIKVHVHTKKPGDILNHCQMYGEYLKVKIENMTLQHSEAKAKKKRDTAEAGSGNHDGIDADFIVPAVKKRFGTVAVASGDGIKKTFLELGVDAVVDGGQCMNPSSADFIRAFDGIRAQTILVFPSNGNIILAAKQAADIYSDAEVRVIPCRTVGESYAALSMLDLSSDDADAIVTELNNVIGQVVTGVVSRAIRSATVGGVTVCEGEYIGYVHDSVKVGMPERREALLGLCDNLDAGKFGVMLLICGKDTPDDEAQAVYRELAARYKRTEIIMIDGGQPIYDYIVTLE